jgi:hypothetical protein
MPFDVQKCIELHNSIVSHACTNLPPERQPILQRNWFEAHSLDASSPDLELDDSLEAFLSGIDIVIPKENQYLSFTPFLIGIASPGEMQPDGWENMEEYEDFVLLYRGPGYDPGGLVYSQATQQVCFILDPIDDPRECMWGDLHDVLELYLHLIDSEKFFVDAKDPAWDPGLDTQYWKFAEWTDEEMTLSLNAWASLVDAITTRLPGKRGDADDQPQAKKQKVVEDDVLIPIEALKRYPAIPPFARAFLSRAKKPSFTSIAPQLDVPNEEFIHRIGAQLQERYPDAKLSTLQHEIIRCPRFLLFPWRTPGVQFVSQAERNRWHTGHPSRILDNRFGLYITPDVFYAHACSLLLPFQLGRNVLRGDGTTLDRPAQDALYQHGMCNPFLPGHGTPLAAILDNWLEQIENEHWQVDAIGVTGESALWKQADTEAHSKDFQPGWDCV